MKPKNFIWVILVIAIIGAGIWWFIHSQAAVSEKIVTAPAMPPAQAEAPKPMAQATGIAQPTALLVGGHSGAPALTVETDTPVHFDPQADLKTALPDLASLWRTGDMYSLVLAYSPPDELTPGWRDHARFMTVSNITDPMLRSVALEYDEGMAQHIEALESQTPTLNRAGDKATYIVNIPSDDDNPDGIKITYVFVKIDGKWYMRNMDI